MTPHNIGTYSSGSPTHPHVPVASTIREPSVARGNGLPKETVGNGSRNKHCPVHHIHQSKNLDARRTQKVLIWRKVLRQAFRWYHYFGNPSTFGRVISLFETQIRSRSHPDRVKKRFCNHQNPWVRSRSDLI
jgi:hypothetical protein